MKFSANKWVFIALTFIFQSSLSMADDFRYFTRYDISNGLPNNTVVDCFSDYSGFLWIGTKDGIYRFDGNSFMVPDGMSSSADGSGMVGAICQDTDGLIWYSTGKGVMTYDPQTGELSRIDGIPPVMYFSMKADYSGNIWLSQENIWNGSDNNATLYRYNIENKSISVYGKSTVGFSPRKVVVDSHNQVWAVSSGVPELLSYDQNRDAFDKISISGTGDQTLYQVSLASDNHLLVATEQNNVYLINTVTSSATQILSIDRPDTEIRDMLERTPGEYWIATSFGLYVIEGGKITYHTNLNGDNHSLSGRDTWRLESDKKGNVWIGTFYNGLNLWKNLNDNYRVLYDNSTMESMDGKMVRALATDNYGSLWIGTEDGGLNKYNLSTHEITSYQIRNSKGSEVNIQGIAIDGDNVWLATFEDGVYIIDRNTGKVVKHTDEPVSGNATISRMPNGDILIGSRKGLYRSAGGTGEIQYVPDFEDCFIHTMLPDSQDGLWVGTYGQGLWYSDRKNRKIYTFTQEDSSHDLASNYITSLFEDSKHRLWITTEGAGLCSVSLEDVKSGKFKFTTLTKDQGLTTNVTSAVAEDMSGRIWVSSSRGIMEINPDDMSVKEIFFGSNDIIGQQYSYGARCITRQGEIFFGTTQGLFGFSPDKIHESFQETQLYITEVVAETESGSRILFEKGKASIFSKKFRVREKDCSTLRIQYAFPDFSLPQTIFYKYSLSRSGKTYSGTTSENSVRFVDIKPGKYKFEINIMGVDNGNTTNSIELTVVPPFYKSTVAYLFYTFIIAGILFFLWKSWDDRKNAEKKRQIEKLEDEKQKEIYKAKLDFFTNITHEIRTPLSLIKMPLDKIVSKKDYTETSKNDLMTMQENTNRLLTLTNQILDMRKMDKNEKELRYVKKDICKQLRGIIDVFVQNANDQHIEMTSDVPETPVIIPLAEDVISTVMGNLLSNAIKYGKDKVEVRFQELGDKIRIRVNSNGKRIPESEKENIFELFYQIDNGESKVQSNHGTGLGLPYARSMARLHHGDLYLDTEYLEMNSFVFDLPLEQPTHLDVEKASPVVEEIRGKEDWDSNRHFVLVVEDDAQMRTYISNELSDEYNVVTAVNGEDALNIVKSQRIDLVVSDVMMPIMDGIQLCNAIKTDMEYSHIPVILLTAAVGVETRMETLQVGADGYLEKPFSSELLKANVANLFKNKEIAYHQFVNSPLTHYNSVNISNADKDYMDKLHDIIVKNMSDSNLNVDSLVDMLNTSKSTLYRKVKGNTGLNINEYIRLCRLKQAAEMLSSQKYRINEVADLVGFSSPSYFATSFQKQFNISPSNFVKQLKGDSTE